MKSFRCVKDIAIPFDVANVNTDAIIPAIWLRDKSHDLGKKLFANWRYRADGSELDEFILNRAPYRTATLLVAGPNFGCGSSREGAVWALMAFGIRCVIAPSFGDIFYTNCFQNGLLPVQLEEPIVSEIMRALQADEEQVLSVDLVSCTVSLPGKDKFDFTIPPDRRESLLEGIDEFSLINRMLPQICEYEAEQAKTRAWLRPHTEA